MSIALTSTRKIQLETIRSDTIKLGNAHPQDVSAFHIQIVDTDSLVTSIVVQARSATPEATTDAAPFKPTVYRKCHLNGSVADGSLDSAALTGDSLIIVPADGMEIALVQTYTSGTGVAYVTPLRGPSVI